MIYNNCIDNKCSNCGECCMDGLPMSDKEFKIIKRYVTKHNIKESINLIPSNDITIDLTCPFRDPINKICKIYEVRPQICRNFQCNKSEKSLLQYRNNMIHKYKTRLLRKELFSNNQIEKYLSL